MQAVAEGSAHLGPEQHAQLIGGLGQAVIATDADCRVTYWSRAAESFYGWTAEEAVGEKITDLMAPEFGRDLTDAIMDRVLAGECWTGAFTVRRKDDTTFAALVTITAVRDADNTLVGTTSVASNIGQLLRPLLAGSKDAAVVTDSNGVVRFVSPVVERVLGWTEAADAGRSLLDRVHPDDHATVERCVQRSLADPTSDPTAEFRVRNTSGGWTWVECRVANLPGDPNVIGLVWMLRDISDRRAALERMTELALHDPLTGLPNRALLTDRLALATARREPHGALLFIDLDDFKKVNDDLGHAAGDALLKTVANRLAHIVRPEDSCGRWSGDEFMVFAESVKGWDDALEFADRVGKAVAEPVEIAGRVLSAQSSIGVAMLDGIHDAQRVISLADEQMYRVKRQHRAQGR
ncbi:MAG: diguanylate cyclase [Frankiales bacterium]|nr:diguanylate cyclase [Frankiales bacterium]